MTSIVNLPLCISYWFPFDFTNAYFFNQYAKEAPIPEEKSELRKTAIQTQIYKVPSSMCKNDFFRMLFCFNKDASSNIHFNNSSKKSLKLHVVLSLKQLLYFSMHYTKLANFRSIYYLGSEAIYVKYEK